MAYDQPPTRPANIYTTHKTLTVEEAHRIRSALMRHSGPYAKVRRAVYADTPLWAYTIYRIPSSIVLTGARASWDDAITDALRAVTRARAQAGSHAT